MTNAGGCTELIDDTCGIITPIKKPNALAMAISSLVNNDEFGQIFITDTHIERTENILKKGSKAYQIFKLDS